MQPQGVLCESAPYLLFDALVFTCFGKAFSNAPSLLAVGGGSPIESPQDHLRMFFFFCAAARHPVASRGTAQSQQQSLPNPRCLCSLPLTHAHSLVVHAEYVEHLLLLQLEVQLLLYPGTAVKLGRGRFFILLQYFSTRGKKPTHSWHARTCESCSAKKSDLRSFVGAERACPPNVDHYHLRTRCSHRLDPGARCRVGRRRNKKRMWTESRSLGRVVEVRRVENVAARARA